jgi:hypothetical protein
VKTTTSGYEDHHQRLGAWIPACWLCCLRARCPLAAAPVRWWRTFSRAGFVAFVAQGGGEVTRRRKGTGAAVNLVMPRYSNDEPCGYHGNPHTSAHHGVVHTWAMSRAGTVATCTATCDGLHGPNYLNAIKDYLPPNGNVASFGGICPHNKFSVSPDAPPALHASAHHGAPALFPTGEPRRAHRDRRRRQLYARDGAIHTPTTAPSTRARTRCTSVSRASLEGV